MLEDLQFSNLEMVRRLEAIRDRMRNESWDSLFVTHPANIRYLSGFRGEPAALWIDQQRAVLITSFRSEHWARAQTETFDVVCEVDPVRHISFLIDSEKTAIGVDDSISHKRLSSLRKIWSGHKVEPQNEVETLRWIKSEAEISMLRESQVINEQIFDKVIQQIRPGMSERAAQGLILALMASEELVDRPAFDPIIAAGANAWEIHHQPDDTVLRDGDMVVIDLGVSVRGYASDMTRTVCLGKASEKMRNIHATVREAQQAAIGVMKQGNHAHEADYAARKIIEAAGHGRSFTHGLGHGIGLETHDAYLRMSPSIEDFEFRSGMALTVEPGLYIENEFGVRIEDTVVIQDYGVENITSTTHDLIEVRG